MKRMEVEFDRETDGRWIAEIASIPGALAYGNTREAAEENVIALAMTIRKCEPFNPNKEAP